MGRGGDGRGYKGDYGYGGYGGKGKGYGYGGGGGGSANHVGGLVSNINNSLESIIQLGPRSGPRSRPRAPESASLNALNRSSGAFSVACSDAGSH